MQADIRAQELGSDACRRGIGRSPLLDIEMFRHIRSVNPSGRVGNPLTLVALKSWMNGWDSASLAPQLVASDRDFDTWIEELRVDVIEREFGYVPGEFGICPEDWRQLFRDGLTPYEAFRRAMAGAYNMRISP